MSGSFCKTFYPFSGEQHQQGLSFEAGEIIKVVQALPGGWWEGEKDGARGWFPSSYVQVLEGVFLIPNTFQGCAQVLSLAECPSINPAVSTPHPPHTP
ncbi:Growth arrest-specific protein 7 [Ilyodon furcidens]|uniref:Growth arrest-specific protein 7 n=2 Tax=Goodeidae TaxID=28758 RepID=A0ABV0MKV5_9TELE